MKLLALDTSSIACSVALQVDDRVYERHEEQPREHTALLLPMIGALLDEAAIAVADLDAIVLGYGPGSFIGMRIAASVAQGLAYGTGQKIVPVSSLAAVAQQALEESDALEVVVVQDARMQQVYLGMYCLDDAGLAMSMAPERLQGLGAIAELEPKADGLRIAAGFGWQRYPELVAANRTSIDELSGVLHPSARYLLPAGARNWLAAGGIDPRSVSPAYLRQKVAAKPAGAT